ncbi:MAG TPA: TonB family protein [Thermoanaerobaculia bacterium]|nr:TonB family protein [Thermoanaerobaculia bacterium]
MGRDRWRRVQELFEAAADLRPSQQAAYLATACAGDDELRREIEALLRSDAEAGSFIEHAIRRGSDLLLAAEPDPLEALGKIGKYEILGRIGEGGFGVVYKGRDAVLQRYVAVKTCSSRDEKLRRRFFREGQIAAGLQHPNITIVYDLGVERGVPYLVQEFLAGEDLNHVIARQEGLTVLRRLDVLAQVARGLEYAHLQGVLHRDVKPANIRILPSGAVKIMDFGIAKLLHEVSDVTTQGVTVGTVGYLAPEQLRGEEVDRRTDIFSFGVLAYELLTYERPFKGSTFSEVSYRLLNEEPAALRDLAPIHSQATAELARRCLAKAPAQRYASFGEIIAVLEPEIAALRSGEAPEAPRVGEEIACPVAPGKETAAGEAVPAPAATHGWLLAAAAVVLAAVLGLGGRALLRPPLPGPPALRQAAEPAGETSRPAAPASPAAAEERGGEGGALRPVVPETSPASPVAQSSPASSRGRHAASLDAKDDRQAPARAAARPPVAAQRLEAPAAEPRGVDVAAGNSAPPGGVRAERPASAAAAPALGTATAGGQAGTVGADRVPESASGAEADASDDGQGVEAAQPGAPLRQMVRGDLIPPGAPGASPPRLVSRPEPAYPDRARRRQVESDVLLLVLVDENGHVIRTIVKRTDDPGVGFNDAARRAALRATFNPASRDGLPGKMWTELPFSFRLHQGG